MSKRKKKIIGAGAGAGAGMLVEEEVVQLEAAKSNLAYTNRSDHNGCTDHDDCTVTPYQKADPVHRGYID